MPSIDLLLLNLELELTVRDFAKTQQTDLTKIESLVAKGALVHLTKSLLLATTSNQDSTMSLVQYLWEHSTTKTPFAQSVAGQALDTAIQEGYDKILHFLTARGVISNKTPDAEHAQQKQLFALHLKQGKTGMLSYWEPRVPDFLNLIIEWADKEWLHEKSQAWIRHRLLSTPPIDNPKQTFSNQPKPRL